MIKLSRILQVSLLTPAIAFSAGVCLADSTDSTEWLVGTWTKTIDEDSGPPDSIIFRADGTFATYDGKCKERINSYFLENGMIFLVIPLAKGPTALVLQPSADRSDMTFTSPRTQNNAVYTRSDVPHCQQRVNNLYKPKPHRGSA